MLNLLLFVLTCCYVAALVVFLLFLLIDFSIKFYKIKKHGISDLFKKAPRPFKTLIDYAKSCGITLKIPYPPQRIKLNKTKTEAWSAQGRTISIPASILDNKNFRDWELDLTYLAHEIGHTQDKIRKCSHQNVGLIKAWCLCPAGEIFAQKRGMEILKILKILPKKKILDQRNKGFSEYIVDILKKNKKCAKNLIRGKCPYLTWPETMQIIDWGI